jgi:hypothetical protein
MKKQELAAYSAFENHRCVAEGDLTTVATQVRTIWNEALQSSTLIFDNITGKVVDVDFRGSLNEVLERLPVATPKETEVAEPDGAAKPGRPKLGVTAREVTLLPRHWEWLGAQPGGASVALRKLVEEARRANADKDKLRQVQEATIRFMTAMAGDFVGFEEASRALYRGERLRFEATIEDWPTDVRQHLQLLAAQSGWKASPTQ